MTGPATRLSILAQGLEGLCLEASPASLAALHPAWAADMERFGPWREDAGGYASLAEAAGEGPGLFACGPCSSTLDVAWRLAGQGEFPPFAGVIAPSQWAGRGQLRRRWISEPGNLLLALAWPMAEPGWDTLVPLLAGHGVVAFLADFGIAARLKWPNDICVAAGQGLAKAGGILVEERAGRIMAGIGLNLDGAPEASVLREQAAFAATSLPQLTRIGGPLAVGLSLVKAMREDYTSLRETCAGPDAAARRIERSLAWLGQEVMVSEADRQWPGRVLGLAPDGGLRLKLPGGGESTLTSGSIAPLS